MERENVGIRDGVWGMCGCGLREDSVFEKGEMVE